MLRITIEVDAPAGQAIGVKEHLAMVLEKFGDTRVVSVEELLPEQLSIDGASEGRQRSGGRADAEEACGVVRLRSYSSIKNYERGACLPPQEKYERILAALGNGGGKTWTQETK